MDERARRLSNLLARGRALHWQNARVLVTRSTGAAPQSMLPARADIVYRSAQILAAGRFIEVRRYLPEAALDGFFADLQTVASGPSSERVARLIEIYAACFEDEARFDATLTHDLSHALLGRVEPVLVAALRATPRALTRTTCLYCAEIFGDHATVRALGG